MLNNIDSVLRTAAQLLVQFLPEHGSAPLYMSYDMLMKMNRDVDAMRTVERFLSTFNYQDEFMLEDTVADLLRHDGDDHISDSFYVEDNQQINTKKLYKNISTSVWTNHSCTFRLILCRIIKLPMSRELFLKIVDLTANCPTIRCSIQDVQKIVLNWIWHFKSNERMVRNICHALQNVSDGSVLGQDVLTEKDEFENVSGENVLRGKDAFNVDVSIKKNAPKNIEQPNNAPIDTNPQHNNLSKRYNLSNPINISFSALQHSINKCICFILQDDNQNVALSNSPSNHLIYIDLNALNIAYLIKNLTLSYEYLIDNDELLVQRFKACCVVLSVWLEVEQESVVVGMVRRVLSSAFVRTCVTRVVLCLDGEYNNDSCHKRCDGGGFRRYFECICNDTFLTGSCSKDGYNNVFFKNTFFRDNCFNTFFKDTCYNTVPPYQLNLPNKLDKINDIFLFNCPLILLHTLSQHTHHLTIHTNSYTPSELNALPPNVHRLELHTIKFAEDYVLAVGVQYFVFKDGAVLDGCAVVINENVWVVDVCDTPGRFLLGMVGEDVKGCILQLERSNCGGVNNTGGSIDEGNSNCSKNSKIDESKRNNKINAVIKVSLIGVRVINRLTLLINTNTNVVIERSTGRIDISNILQGYNTTFTTEMVVKYEGDSLTLKKLIIDSTVNTCKDVRILVLEHISIAQDAMLIVNKSCEQLVIKHCSGRIMAKEVHQLKRIDLMVGVDRNVVFANDLWNVSWLRVHYDYLHREWLIELIGRCVNVERLSVCYTYGVNREEDGEIYRYGNWPDEHAVEHDLPNYGLDKQTEQINDQSGDDHERKADTANLSIENTLILINEFLHSIIGMHSAIKELELSGFTVNPGNMHLISSNYCLVRLTACSTALLYPFPSLKYLNIHHPKQHLIPITDLLTNIPSIQTFISHNYIFPNQHFLSTLPTSLQNLKLPLYTFTGNLIVRDKLKIRKIVICGRDVDGLQIENGKLVERSSLYCMMEVMCDYVEFAALDVLAYEYCGLCYFLDIVCWEVIGIEKRSVDFDE